MEPTVKKKKSTFSEEISLSKNVLTNAETLSHKLFCVFHKYMYRF